MWETCNNNNNDDDDDDDSAWYWSDFNQDIPQKTADHMTRWVSHSLSPYKFM